MDDALLESELPSACASLGYFDGSRNYQLEAHCLETIKDLIRYLKKDDDTHQIRRALGNTNIVMTDLVPIIEQHGDDKELFDVTLRLLVNLTNPVLLLFKEELPEEKVTRQYFLQILTQQQRFKEAFARENIWRVLISRLEEILGQDYNDREEEDRMTVERILILVRNIFAIPADPQEERRTDDDASLHDEVVWALCSTNFRDLILYISSTECEQDLCMHVLEVVQLMLKEQDASELAIATPQRSLSEKQKDVDELMKMRQKEISKKREQEKRQHSLRHSRFGGTYYVTNMKSISDNNLITHNHMGDIQALNFDANKKGKKIPKNRLPVQDTNLKRRSTLKMRLFLKEFCIDFLDNAYNTIMQTVKDNLNRALTQEHDESYYLWAIEFFLQFNRSYNFKVELVTETINLQLFHYIQTLLDNYFEMMITDKKKIPIWSRRMHVALLAYKELFMTISFMDKSQEPSIKESSKILKSKVFYVVEYRELVLILLQNYDELKMSKTYLKDLVETSHIFLKLLEGLCGKQKHLMVQRKKKVKQKKKPLQRSEELPLTEDELLSLWDQQSDNLLEILSNENDLPEMLPFDPLSELSEKEQKESAMKKIHKHLRSGELESAVSLLRSSREVWPEGDVFGSSDIDPMGEVFCLRAVFMANINTHEEPVQEAHVDIDVEEEEYGMDEEVPLMSEQEFNFEEFIRRFAHSKVVQAYALLFKNFFSNSEYTNHCILKMFHRLAWDCKLPGVFFQASVFRVFQQILHAPPADFQKDAIKFVKYVLRKFFEISLTNKKVFAELLFWKTNKEALELEVGYGCADTTKTKILWKEEEEDELQRLYEEFKDNACEGKDVVDLILDNLINKQRTRRMVIKKLKDLGLVNNLRELTRKAVRVRAPKQWTEEEEEELKVLFEENKESIDPVSRIIDHMIIKRPKLRVIEKILELGLVQDKKELRKKRTKKAKDPSVKSGKKKNHGEAFLQANASESEDDFENSDDDLQSSEDESYSISVREKVPVATPENIKGALRRASLNGHVEAIEWIAGLLIETANDREEDGDFEPIPVLAITPASITAIEDAAFGELLSLIGLQAPLKEQEMFWRIPSNLSVQDLKKRSQFLLQGMEGEDTYTSEFDSIVPHNDKENLFQDVSYSTPLQSSEDRSVLSNLGNRNLNSLSLLNKAANAKLSSEPIKRAQENDQRPVLIQDDDSDSSETEIESVSKNDVTRKRNFIDSDDSDEEVIHSSKKAKAIIISDDSDID